MLPLFREKEPDQLRLPGYVKVNYDRFYEIKTNIVNNKYLATTVKDASGKTINTDLKDTLDLIDQILKNVTYNEVKKTFNDKIVNKANIIASPKLTNNRIKMFKIFFDLEQVLSGKLCDIKIVDGE